MGGNSRVGGGQEVWYGIPVLETMPHNTGSQNPQHPRDRAPVTEEPEPQQPKGRAPATRAPATRAPATERPRPSNRGGAVPQRRRGGAPAIEG